MLNIKNLIEEINALAEDEFVDEFEANELDLADTPVMEEPFPSAEVGTTEKLEARTNISRALDLLKKAVEDFKDSAIEEIEFIGDDLLLQSIESLDAEIETIASSLDIGKPAPVEVEEVPAEDEMPSESEEEEMDFELEELDDEEQEPDFELEAGLDLFGSEE